METLRLFSRTLTAGRDEYANREKEPMVMAPYFTALPDDDLCRDLPYTGTKSKSELADHFISVAETVCKGCIRADRGEIS
jgi:hypothetical protein